MMFRYLLHTLKRRAEQYAEDIGELLVGRHFCG